MDRRYEVSMRVFVDVPDRSKPEVIMRLARTKILMSVSTSMLWYEDRGLVPPKKEEKPRG